MKRYNVIFSNSNDCSISSNIKIYSEDMTSAILKCKDILELSSVDGVQNVSISEDVQVPCSPKEDRRERKEKEREF